MYKKIISLIIFSLLVSCGNKEIKLSDLVDRGNLFYKINSEKPYTGKFISYYEFNQEKNIVESVGYFKDGKLEGDLVKYFANGQISEKGLYKANKKNGKFITYVYNGQIIKTEEYKDGNLNGIYTLYFDSHNVYTTVFDYYKEKGEYSMGKKLGEWIYNNSNGDVIRIENYVDGDLSGYFEETKKTSYYYLNINQNSRERLIKTFGKYHNGYKIGVWKILEGDKVLLEHRHSHGKNVSFEGEWITTNMKTGKKYYSKFENGKYYNRTHLSLPYEYKANYSYNVKLKIYGREYYVSELSANNYTIRYRDTYEGERMDKLNNTTENSNNSTSVSNQNNNIVLTKNVGANNLGKEGVIKGTDVIIREGYSTNSKIIGSFKKSGERVAILDSYYPNNNGETLIQRDITVKTNISTNYNLQKGKSVTILSRQNGNVKIQFKDKELRNLTTSINESYLDKSVNSKWYKVKRNNGEIGWVFGKFIELK